MPQSPVENLILVPTEFEIQYFVKHDFAKKPNCFFGICGFGPIAAGIGAARLIQKHAPKHVFLVGIAGGYAVEQDVLEIGAAYEFHEVASYGVGAGANTKFLSPRDLRLPQTVDSSGHAIFDELRIVDPFKVKKRRQLLTVCSAAANDDEVQLRRRSKPNSVAEDMEGFSVALACRLAGARLSIVRGISNWAGDRNIKNWKVESAIRSASNVLQQLLEIRTSGQ